MGKKSKKKVVKKGKKKVKPHVSSKKYSKYKLEGEKLVKARTCAKCGPAVFLAQHKDRLLCGACGYMEKKN